MQLELQHASRVPLLRTPPEGFCSSSYKHATPNGVNRKRFFSRLRQWVDLSDAPTSIVFTTLYDSESFVPQKNQIVD